MTDDAALGAQDVRIAARLLGLELSDDEAAAVVPGLTRNRDTFTRLRAVRLANDVPSALEFVPVGRRGDTDVTPWGGTLPEAGDPPWAGLTELASLVRARAVSCVELCERSLARLEALDPVLHLVVTPTRERALARASERDAELADGVWRGPLHGIPWGAKDLLAVAGYPTTWGSPAYRSQVLDRDAAVVRRLDEAGAVLVAKLSLGELAMGDRWFGGMTRNPWNPERGSSGSSAGSAAAVASGCVPFAIGSETLGSILSPSSVCGCSSLRPTYGAVSREGAMTLAPTMDKLGPMARSLHDAAVVFDAIRDTPFVVPGDVDLTGWTVGVLEATFERHPECAGVLDELRALGVRLRAIELPEIAARDMLVILNSEAAAWFDELDTTLLANQGPGSWATSFLQSRLIPAVDYIRANRMRTVLMRAMDDALGDVDVYVHPATTSRNLAATNLTGHPSAVAPCAYAEDGTPRAIAFTGRLDGESKLLAVAGAWQRSTSYHLRHPDL